MERYLTRPAVALLASCLAIWGTPAQAQKFNTDALLNDILFSGINETRFVNDLQLRAATQASQIATICDFDEQQKQKVLQAVEGDVARLRRSIITLRQQARDLPERLDMMKQQREVQSMAAAFQKANEPDAWIESSLFARTIQTLATPEQKDKLKSYLVQRQTEYERACVLQTIVMIEQTMLLTEKQRNWLLDHLLSAEVPRNSKATLHAIGFQKLSQIKPETMKELFSEEEINKLSRLQSAVVRPTP